MSKQDTHFFNVFSLVIGILVCVAIFFFAVSRIVAGRTQGEQVFVEKEYLRAVEERIKPFARVAVAGQDNSALAIATPAAGSAGAGVQQVALETGSQVYEQVCAACHGGGIAGAPKTGDTATWAPRIAKGNATLYQHAIQGFQGSAGVMPAKGGRADVSDELIRAAVDHMIEQSR